MYESYIIPSAIVIFLLAFVLGLNVGMMLMQGRNPKVAESLYSKTPVRRDRRDLSRRDFVLDFGLP